MLLLMWGERRRKLQKEVAKCGTKGKTSQTMVAVYKLEHEI